MAKRKSATAPMSCADYRKEFTNIIVHKFARPNSALEIKDVTETVTLNQEPSETLTLKFSISKNVDHCESADRDDDLTSYIYSLNLTFRNHVHYASRKFQESQEAQGSQESEDSRESQDYSYRYDVIFSALVQSLDNRDSFHVPLFSHTAERIGQTLTFPLPGTPLYTENIGQLVDSKRRKIREGNLLTRARETNFKLLHVCCGLRRCNARTMSILPVQSLISIIRSKEDDEYNKILNRLMQSYITGKQDGILSNCMHELYEAAHHCNIPFLKRQCLEYMMFRMDDSNVGYSLKLAEKYKLQFLKQCAIAFEIERKKKTPTSGKNAVKVKAEK